MNVLNPQYTWGMVEAMKASLSRNGVLGKGKGLTFALRGIFLGDSIEQIQWLLDQTSDEVTKSTVTIWGTDDLSNHQLEGLKSFLKTIGKDRCYTDTTANI